ncbi:hypothetical protein Lesp02_15970 [Lentzea sp. NBRC 105346]|nr:hypothetical protein Lesp02_15970 [Lentzea sp. NBRC 105346]
MEHVRKHGWSVLHVFGNVDFVYTVGLWHTFRRPEIAMFGLDGKSMQHWVNLCVTVGHDNGWPADDEPFQGVIDGVDTQLRKVHKDWDDPLFNSAFRFYSGVRVPFLQLVWPDREGRWPWDDRATTTCRTRQAWAWLPVHEHPPGGWKLIGELEPDFLFPCGPDSWTLTSQAVVDGRRSPVWVLHDEGAFDVLDERGYGADDLCLAFLGDLVNRHPGLRLCAALPDGHAATKDGTGWPAETPSDVIRHRSKLAWEGIQ